MAKRWYVVQSNVKTENIAVQNLKDQRFTVFLPQISEVRKIRGKMVTESLPLFPSYLFVQFDINRSRWRSILGTRGVKTLLGATEEYASPLPKGFVEDLLKQADKRGVLSIRKAERVVAKYKTGDTLRVKEGLFMGLTGTCQKIQQEFAVLLLSLQSGDFEIKLPIGLLESP